MEKRKKNYKQGARHDWLGDAAESYVAYYFASPGFEVFGAGKWAADVVVRDLKIDRWWRVEVKSTDKQKPRHFKKADFRKFAKKAEIFVWVFFRNGNITMKAARLSARRGCGKLRDISKPKELREMLYKA